MSAEFLSVFFLDSCKKLLVVSELMGPSVQITLHIITLNGSDSANIRSALRNNQQDWLPPSLKQYGVKDWMQKHFKQLTRMMLFHYGFKGIHKMADILSANSNILPWYYCSLPQCSSVCSFHFCLHIYVEILSNSG